MFRPLQAARLSDHAIRTVLKEGCGEVMIEQADTGRYVKQKWPADFIDNWSSSYDYQSRKCLEWYSYGKGVVCTPRHFPVVDALRRPYLVYIVRFSNLVFGVNMDPGH